MIHVNVRYCVLRVMLTCIYTLLSSYMYSRSSYVATLYLNPQYPSGTGLSFPLSHLTLVDLKHPVESAGLTVISGRDHHSAELIEHLEVACYQPQTSTQVTIQQYHVPIACIQARYLPSIPSVTSTTSLQGSTLHSSTIHSSTNALGLPVSPLTPLPSAPAFDRVISSGRGVASAKSTSSLGTCPYAYMYTTYI